MKIILLLGQSGVGKTTIAKFLCEEYSNKYNYINSFTNRTKRSEDEWGHEFVSTATINAISKEPFVVAKSSIDGYKYCACATQFDENKINIYITDLIGANNTIDFYPHADIMTILIRKKEISEYSDERNRRDISLPSREEVDFVIDNNGTVKTSAETINVLVNSDLFRKPSHKIKTIEDSLNDVEEQFSYLKSIKESLERQLWYRDKQLYINLYNYLKEQSYDDFDVTIAKDDDPTWDGESCPYLLFAIYEEKDLQWVDTERIYELVSKHIHDFCEQHHCNDLIFRISVHVIWEGEFIRYE